MQQSHPDLAGKLTVHFGGPVEPRVGFVLHSKDFMLAQHELAAGGHGRHDRPGDAGRDRRRPRARRSTSSPSAIPAGGRASLEMEMQQGDWLVVPSDPDLIFAPDPKKIWERALAKYQTTL